MPKKAAASKKKKPTQVKRSSMKIAKKKITKSIAKPKKKKVLAIPKGYHSITPILVVNGGSRAIEFYKKAFGAKIVMRMERPDGKIAHAELKINDAKIMLADESPEMGANSPVNYGGSPVGIHLYIKDVDAVVKRAVGSGARIIRPVENMFYGDRAGEVQDPFGHKWYISTHVEDVSPATMRKRAAELFGKK